MIHLAALFWAFLGAHEDPLPVSLTQEPPGPTEAELIQKLANPLAALLTLDLTSDFDYRIGPDRQGVRYTFAAQPQVPIALGDGWNLISRTIVPVVYQEDVAPGAGDQFGLGDLVEALFITTGEPGRRGWLGGLGPILRMPTGSDDLLTQDQWQFGPTAAFVKPQDAFTLGIIGNHLATVEGSEKRPDASVSLVEPFIDFITPDLWTVSLHVPAAFDWKKDEWTVPVIVSVKKLTTLQGMPVHLTFGVRYWAESPEGGPHDFGFRFGLTLVLPR